MTDFLENYIATASSDPQAAFDMLTPAFQKRSGGMTGYQRFWGNVRSAEVLEVSADPATLEVSYPYRYNRGSRRAHRGRPRPEADLRERHLPHRPGAVRPVFTPEGEVFGGRFGVKCA